MNTTSSNTWTPADIASIVNIGVTFLVFALNIHQSWSHRHFHSECFGHHLMSLDSGHSDPPTSHHIPRIVVTPPHP